MSAGDGTTHALPELVGGSSSRRGDLAPTTPLRPLALEEFDQAFDGCAGCEKIVIEFGRTVIPRGQARQLQDGHVLPLEQRVDDPVALRLGDQVVARGEVVFVGGKLAIRITEVA